jgi:osmotically-inducible protein OsmY
MGQELLPGIQHVLKVLLTAPLDYQVEKVREREGLDEAAGRRYVEGVNKARSRRMEAIFGADWRDASRYDLVLNVGQMTVDTLARLIEDAAGSAEYQKTAESERAFVDLSLTSRVQAALIVSPKTRNLNVRVRAEGGVVHVSGILTQPALQEEIVSVAKEVPGTNSVETDFESPPVEYMFP